MADPFFMGKSWIVPVILRTEIELHLAGRLPKSIEADDVIPVEHGAGLDT